MNRRYDRPLRWLTPPSGRARTARVRYTGTLARPGRALELHLGYDGWSAARDVPMERDADGGWVAEVPTAGRFVVDCVVRDAGGSGCDNNDNADYRLWIALDPVDAHVHARAPGGDALGFDSLRTAAHSGGMTHAVVSWTDNDFVEIAAEAVPWLTPLVWVRPGGPDPDSLRRRLAAGAAGLKLHPAYDAYPADIPGLDPYLRVAAEAGVPVTVHSSPGPADPDLIRRLAERFPTVPFVLYHTFLGPLEGRRRAARHARELPNLHLETSWCRSAEAERLLDEVGPDRVLFGSDAATDGPQHFVRRPPNIEMVENYNGALLRLARRLRPVVFRRLVEDNARALFGIPRPAYDAEPSPEELRALLATALDELRRLVGAVRPDQTGRPTPCAAWTLGDLLAHVLTAVRRAAVMENGRPAQHAGDETEFAFAVSEARRAWARPQALTGSVVVPWGRVPAPVVLAELVLELTAHAQDIAAALGDAKPLDEDLATAALRIATRLVPPGLRDAGTYGPPTAAPAGADAGTRLAAFLGRRVTG